MAARYCCRSGPRRRCGTQTGARAHYQRAVRRAAPAATSKEPSEGGGGARERLARGLRAPGALFAAPWNDGLVGGCRDRSPAGRCLVSERARGRAGDNVHAPAANSGAWPRGRERDVDPLARRGGSRRGLAPTDPRGRRRCRSPTCQPSKDATHTLRLPDEAVHPAAQVRGSVCARAAPIIRLPAVPCSAHRPGHAAPTIYHPPPSQTPQPPPLLRPLP